MKRGKEDLSFVISHLSLLFKMKISIKIECLLRVRPTVPSPLFLLSMTNEKCEMTNDKSIAYSLRRLGQQFPSRLLAVRCLLSAPR